jgi:hypothetical protein
MAAECCLLEGDLEGFHRIVTGLEDPELQTGVQARLIMTQAIQGISLITNGDPDGSRAVFSKVMQLVESEPEVEQTPFAHYGYGVALRVMGEDPEATEHLDQAEKLLKNLRREGILTTLQIRENLLTQTLRQFHTTS